MSSTYHVILTETGPKLLAIIKTLVNFTGLSRDEIMEGLEELPMTVPEDFTREKAKKLLAELLQIGAKATMEENASKDQETYDVFLMDIGRKSMAVAKVIAHSTERDLDEILEAVEILPFTIATEISMDEAKALQMQLEPLGAKVALKPHQEMSKEEDENDGDLMTLLKAAEQGNPYAQYNIGLRYAQGEGIGQNLEVAAKWYLKAAEQGHTEAQCSLGICYVKGEGIEKNPEEAVKWFRKAAEQGNPRGQCNLGLSYAQGLVVMKNPAEAIKWFRKSAEQGYARGQFNLGFSYATGRGVEKNPTEAVKWYRMAAEQGLNFAQLQLGICYKYGSGVEKNLGEAVSWFRKSAEQGHSGAQCNLGICYDNGEGVEKDPVEAIKWFKKAVEQGDKIAQYQLGLHYENGIGVKKDLEEADRWFNMASEQGYEKAIRKRIDFILKSINDAQVFTQYNKNQEKLNNAIAEYAQMASQEQFMLQVDDTIFGSADEGCVITDKALYIRGLFEDGKRIPLNRSIKNIQIREENKIIIDGRNVGTLCLPNKINTIPKIIEILQYVAKLNNDDSGEKSSNPPSTKANVAASQSSNPSNPPPFIRNFIIKFENGEISAIINDLDKYMSAGQLWMKQLFDNNNPSAEELFWLSRSLLVTASIACIRSGRKLWANSEASPWVKSQDSEAAYLFARISFGISLFANKKGISETLFDAYFRHLSELFVDMDEFRQFVTEIKKKFDENPEFIQSIIEQMRQ